MSMGPYDPAPDADEVLQDETPGTAIPVVIDTPVRTQRLPNRLAGMGTLNVDNVTAKRLAGSDPRRASLLILAHDQEILLASTQGGCLGEYAARWPQDLPLLLSSSDELWAMAATSNTDITVIAEQWTE